MVDYKKVIQDPFLFIGDLKKRGYDEAEAITLINGITTTEKYLRALRENVDTLRELKNQISAFNAYVKKAGLADMMIVFHE